MDLNLRPAAYKAADLPTELWGQCEGLACCVKLEHSFAHRFPRGYLCL